MLAHGIGVFPSVVYPRADGGRHALEIASISSAHVVWVMTGKLGSYPHGTFVANPGIA
jgi:hypothetical protein